MLESIFLAAARVYQYIPSFTTIVTTAATSAKTPGAERVSLFADSILSTPAQPIAMPVANTMIDNIMAATDSNRSWPYGCSLSASLLAIFTPTITISVLNISEKDSAASESIAAECAKRPAKSLKVESSALPIIQFVDTLTETFSLFLSIAITFYRPHVCRPTAA